MAQTRKEINARYKARKAGLLPPRNRPMTGTERNNKYMYGITLQGWEDLYMAQGGKCAICSKGCSRDGLVIDHNHLLVKQHRGLLCNSCNVAIGLFHEDINTMQNAIAYLKHYNQSMENT